MKRLAWLAAALFGCSSSPPAPPPAPTEVSFPAGFLWGSATAGFQIEKGLGDTDWGIWAATPGKIAGGDKPDDGPDAFAHVSDDIAAMKAAGFGAYRFSIELARVYPTRNTFDDDTPDAAGLAKYDALFAALAKEKIVPMVTLHHFAWPSYLSDPNKNKEPQGWERADALDVFAGWCGRMAKRYGDKVDLWVTINEPNVEATVGYVATVFAPGVSDVERAATVMRNQVTAHARCFDAIHQADTADADGDGKAALVGIAQHDRVYEAKDPASEDDLAAAERARYVWNQWIMDTIVLGKVDADFDGTPEKTDAKLAGHADFFGLNYYGVSQVSASGLKLKYIGITPAIHVLGPRPKTDVGWDIYPEGFGKVLDEAAGYGLPIYITENGIADGKDVNRTRFVAEHLFELGKAIARGAKVRGYLHWSLVDNFEWASGFCPRFGLYRVDYADPNRKRSPTSAVSLLADVAKTGKLAQARIDALPPYQSAPMSCASF